MPNYKKYLNPLFKELKNLNDFSNVDRSSTLLGEEYPHLEKITQILASQVQGSLNHMDDLNVQIEKQIYEIENTTGDDKSDAVSTYNKLLKQVQEVVDKTNLRLSSIDNPYFGKIQFHRNANDIFPKSILEIYFGKFALIDTDSNKMLITDWRAPIANLYYQNSGPCNNVEFRSPVGIQSGNLTQKRQFEISRARISNIYDSKTGNAAADEFLLAQLKGRIGKKLTDIVATIQAQQNEIIREDINKTVIIQGVAGSGKTTILLHRIAYLLFTYQKEITPKNTLVIAPNKLFLDYISDLLPSLGIEGIEENTFLFWAKNILEWNDRYSLSTISDDLEIKKYKGSYQYKLYIEEYFKSFEEDLLEKIPSTLKYDIADRYYALKVEHPEISMKERLELAIDYSVVQKQFRKNLRAGYVAPLDNTIEKVKEIKDYINKRFNAYRIYKNMLDHAVISENISKDIFLKMKSYNKKTLSSSNGLLNYKLEDLPAILWLHFQLYGTKEYEREYIVADEAQDLSVFQMLILKMVAKNNNVTFAGDIAQSIIPPFYIKDWEEVLEVFRKEDGNNAVMSYHQLNKCYRTTIEIINFANKIFKQYFSSKYKLPEAVLRHGDEVEIIESENFEDIIKIVNNDFKKGSVNIALICKNIQHADEIYEKISQYKSKIKRPLIHYKEDNYQGGLLVLPVERAKGLEFDTVILMEMTKEHYSGNDLDIRLLYVAITRALHRLYVHTPKKELLSDLILMS